MANISEVTAANFEAEVLKVSDIPVIVDFWASWCAPCLALAPILETIGQEQQGKVKIVKLNVEGSTELADKFGVSSIPTLIIFKNGQQVDRIVGLQTREAILKRLGDLK